MHQRRLIVIYLQNANATFHKVDTIQVSWETFNHVKAYLMSKIFTILYHNRPRFVKDMRKLWCVF